MATYYCPNCGEEIEASCFDGEAHCEKCGKTYVTDWDYVSDENIGTWITNEEVNEMK